MQRILNVPRLDYGRSSDGTCTQIGRLNAHHLVEAACKTAVAQKQHLKDVVSELDEVKGHFSQAEIRNILNQNLFRQYSSSD
jgi:3-carboxy-cis,cis-muconate cycloisomerase